jgi:hypothetical protein
MLHALTGEQPLGFGVGKTADHQRILARRAIKVNLGGFEH